MNATPVFPLPTGCVLGLCGKHSRDSRVEELLIFEEKCGILLIIVEVCASTEELFAAAAKVRWVSNPLAGGDHHMKAPEADQTESFAETKQEPWEKYLNAKKEYQHIPEEAVADLEYVDVSGSLYVPAKRCLDILLSAVVLLVLLIPMIIIAAVIYLDNPGKVIFSQNRVGRNGKRFKMYKFRTMKKTTPKYIATMDLSNPQRHITRVGRILRKLSLDELPQLWNVLKGDMSLIGPRPLISDEYDIHTMRLRFGVYDIRPGITGLAQINGRDKILPVEKLHWDVRYLREFSFWSDLKIVLITIPSVLLKKDIKEGR